MSGDLARARDVFSLDKLEALMAEIPPTPIFASCSLFPKDVAYQWDEDGQSYLVAHEDFWRKLPTRDYREKWRGQERLLSNTFSAIQIRDLDHALERELRDRVFASFGRRLGFQRWSVS